MTHLHSLPLLRWLLICCLWLLCGFLANCSRLLLLPLCLLLLLLLLLHFLLVALLMLALARPVGPRGYAQRGQCCVCSGEVVLPLPQLVHHILLKCVDRLDHIAQRGKVTAGGSCS